MRKILLIALLAAFASATTLPTLATVLGFDQTAYAIRVPKPPKKPICPPDFEDCQGDQP
jgi:hypothetical protein